MSYCVHFTWNFLSLWRQWLLQITVAKRQHCLLLVCFQAPCCRWVMAAQKDLSELVNDRKKLNFCCKQGLTVYWNSISANVVRMSNLMSQVLWTACSLRIFSGLSSDVAVIQKRSPENWSPHSVCWYNLETSLNLWNHFSCALTCDCFYWPRIKIATWMFFFIHNCQPFSNRSFVSSLNTRLKPFFLSWIRQIC